jgi:hypothetical protein
MRSLIVLSMFLLFVFCSTGCDNSSKYKAFIQSHDAIHPGMSISEAFEAGLADYLILMGNKNVAGGTLQKRQPAGETCRRYIFDISYYNSSPPGKFSVRVFCNMNEPTAAQVIPPKSFTGKQEFLNALDSDYATWAPSMSFRVESPPKRFFGVYDHYEIRTDAKGKVTSVSPINISK